MATADEQGPEHRVIRAVVWSAEAQEGLRSVSPTESQLDPFVVEPEWATEAATDPKSLRTQQAKGVVLAVGWSTKAPGRTLGVPGRLLRVWVKPGVDDIWDGVFARDALPEDQGRYDHD